MSTTLPVVEIFSSIEGEGIRAGYPCTFIRLVGCNLRCFYCDTTYSYTRDETTSDMTIDEIVDKCRELNNTRITLTGGEPLLNPNTPHLIFELLEENFYVNVETNGSYPILTNPEYSFYREVGKLIFTVDYKSPSSGMCDKMCLFNFGKMSSHDVLKFVVGSTEDLEAMKKICTTYKTSLSDIGVHLFVSPVFGKIEPQKIVEYLLYNNLQNIRIQLQLHKFIWDPAKKGV